MKTNTTYIPLEWQLRIKRIRTLQLRARVAVYLIGAYKRRQSLNPDRAVWKRDADLGRLAFWPPHARADFTQLHLEFLKTDMQYRKEFELSSKQAQAGNTFGAAQNVHTQP